MKDIHNYIQEKLFIDKEYASLNLIENTIIRFFVKNGPIKGKDDSDKAFAVIKKWVKDNKIKNVEYITSFDFNNDKYNRFFNCNLLKTVDAKHDKEKEIEYSNELEHEYNSGNCGVGSDKKYNIYGSYDTWIMYTDKLLWIWMGDGNHASNRIMVHKV